MRLQWAHAVVFIRGKETMLDFYTKILGFEVTDRGWVGPEGGPEIVFMSQVHDHHHQLAFLDIRQDEDKPNSVDHFAFRVDSLADVREMIERLEKDGRATELNPLTHGNAWSIYFKDPEKNGIEVFCDTPWHVPQPQIQPWDPSLSDDELRAWTLEKYQGEKGFTPIGDFYAARAKALAES
jgi:catechol 2,3-dioxygenase